MILTCIIGRFCARSIAALSPNFIVFVLGRVLLASFGYGTYLTVYILGKLHYFQEVTRALKSSRSLRIFIQFGNELLRQNAFYTTLKEEGLRDWMKH